MTEAAKRSHPSPRTALTSPPPERACPFCGSLDFAGLLAGPEPRPAENRQFPGTCQQSPDTRLMGHSCRGSSSELQRGSVQGQQPGWAQEGRGWRGRCRVEENSWAVAFL